MMGRVPDKPKASFVQLLANLQAQSGKAGPTIRIGGNSADGARGPWNHGLPACRPRSTHTHAPFPHSLPLESLWNPSGTAAPAGTHYNITQDDLDSYKQFLAEASATRLVIDTTLEFGNTTKWAVEHIAAVGKTLPWASEFVEAVEIGNEVDLFAGNGGGPGIGLRGDDAARRSQFLFIIFFHPPPPCPRHPAVLLLVRRLCQGV
jgi:hypothetical protein